MSVICLIIFYDNHQNLMSKERKICSLLNEKHRNLFQINITSLFEYFIERHFW